MMLCHGRIVFDYPAAPPESKGNQYTASACVLGMGNEFMLTFLSLIRRAATRALSVCWMPSNAPELSNPQNWEDAE